MHRHTGGDGVPGGVLPFFHEGERGVSLISSMLWVRAKYRCKILFCKWLQGKGMEVLKLIPNLDTQGCYPPPHSIPALPQASALGALCSLGT